MKPSNRQHDQKPSGSYSLYEAEKKEYIPRLLFDIVYLAFPVFLLFKYPIVAQVLNLNSAQFLWVLFWVIVIVFLIDYIWGNLGHAYVLQRLFLLYTGLRYSKNRMVYARAGGYDIGHWSVMLTQVAIFGIFWHTSTMNPDPIAPMRSIWGYIGVTIVISFILQVVLASLAFGFYAHRLGQDYSLSFSLRSLNTILCCIQGSILFDLDKIEQAIPVLQKALRSSPEHRPTRNLLAGAYYDRGVLLARKQQYEEAIAVTLQSIQFNPGYAPAHNNLGVCLYALRRHEKAFASYREALRLDPNDAAAHNNMGEVLVALWRYDEAITECQEAIRLNPLIAEPHYHIGRAYLEMGRRVDAIHAWEESLRVDPNFEPVLRSLPKVRKLDET